MTAASQLALLFPGQGAAEPAMRELVAEQRPDLLALVAELVGEDPFPRLDDGTRFAQPAIYCAALAGFESLGRPRAGLCAGHSLGEITALAAAGALAESDGLRAVVARGRLMDEAGAREPGGMVAVGGERERAAELAAERRARARERELAEPVRPQRPGERARPRAGAGAHARPAGEAARGRRRFPLGRDGAPRRSRSEPSSRRSSSAPRARP